jgi:hypothetical protein
MYTATAQCHVNNIIALRILLCTATSYEGDHRNSMQLTNVGCNGSENNLTSCCAGEIFNSMYCHSGAYAGVRCMQL